MTTLTIGPYRLIVKYLFRPKGRNNWHYRRLVPADLRKYYNSPQILKSLQTADETEALKRCLTTNQQVEQEFKRHRYNLPRTLTMQNLHDADQLLRQHNLAPRAWSVSDPLDYDEEELKTINHLGAGLQDHFESVIRNQLSSTEYDEYQAGEKEAADYLPRAEQMALALLKGELRLKASEQCDYYIELRQRGDDQKFCQGVNNAKLFLLKHLPDKRPGSYSRFEVRQLINSGLTSGLKTKTIQRYLSTLRTAFTEVSHELECREDQLHPFTKFKIPHLAEDMEDRAEFSFAQLEVLREAQDKRKPEITWLIHLMMETGMRVNEACGIRAEDINQQGNHPFVRLHKNAFRRLKNRNSHRYIPLVGVALKACKAAANASTSEWLFPNYIDFDKAQTKNTAASAAVNKRLRSELGEDAPTAHSFRHTLRTRLRQVECPEALAKEIGGWQKDISQSYGSTTDIEVKTKHLKKAMKLQHQIGFRTD